MGATGSKTIDKQFATTLIMNQTDTIFLSASTSDLPDGDTSVTIDGLLQAIRRQVCPPAVASELDLHKPVNGSDLKGKSAEVLVEEVKHLRRLLVSCSGRDSVGLLLSGPAEAPTSETATTKQQTLSPDAVHFLTTSDIPDGVDFDALTDSTKNSPEIAEEEGESTFTVRRITRNGIVYVREDDDPLCLTYVRKKVTALMTTKTTRGSRRSTRTTRRINYDENIDL